MSGRSLLCPQGVALIFIALLIHATPSGALLAALSIDLGSQFMKIGLVKPGVPMEIVLNRESHRKTPSIVGIRNGERAFSDPAAQMAIKFPKFAYSYLMDLLGKKLDNPVVQKFHKRFPQFKLVADQNRGTVRFEQNESESYSVEELVAMLLADARHVAEKFAEQPVKDVVITVPPFFNQAERRAMVHAANIAGFNLLQLMNDNTAAGLNYGIFRRNQFNDTASLILIYDMGATKTTATVIQYHMVKEKYEKNPQMTVLGVGFDRTLGGLEITLRLRDYLLAKFVAEKKHKGEITENARSMAKLFKEAERLKQVLSANANHVAQIEGLFEDIDFKAKVSREDLEALVPDLFERVAQPVKDALRMAETDMEQIGHVIMMGGATRVPKVQENLQAAVKGMELGKYLNTDEAIALGAVYQAAHLSKGFKVKKFIVKESTLFPISVDFHKETASIEEEQRVIHRNLFSYRNQYPQKKVMTFSKHTKDFEFAVNYGDMNHINDEQKSEFGALNISRVDLSEVGDIIAENVVEGSEYKGVKAHFRLDDSGIIVCDSAEVVVEKIAKVEEGTLSKLGKKLSALFGGSEDETKTEVEHEKNEKDDEKKDANENKESSKEKSNEEKPKSEEKKEEKTNGKTDDKTGDETKSNDTKSDKKIEPPQPQIVKLAVKMEKAFMDMPNITEEEIAEGKQKLADFTKKEAEKSRHEAALNNLESFVFETRDKLEQEEYVTLTTEEERELFMTQLNAASEWLEETVDASTPTDDLEGKIDDLKKLTQVMFDRYKEGVERPRAFEALTQMLNYSNVFLTGMRNLTGEMQIFTDKEVELLEKTITDSQTWFDEMKVAQDKLAGHETAAVTVRDLAEKINALDREVKYLLNKARTTKPKVPKIPSNQTIVNGTDETIGKEENKEDITNENVQGAEKSEAKEENEGETVQKSEETNKEEHEHDGTEL